MSEVDDALPITVSSGLPVVAIEAARTQPTMKTIFPHAKVVGVMSGRARVTTASGEAELCAGDGTRPAAIPQVVGWFA